MSTVDSESDTCGRKHKGCSRRQRDTEASLAKIGLALANWSERWFPDPLVFALVGVVIIFVFGLLLHIPASKLAVQGAKNFWTLVPFTMQMVMVIIGGYVVATTPPVYRLIQVACENTQKRTWRHCDDRAIRLSDLADLLGSEPDLQRAVDT